MKGPYERNHLSFMLLALLAWLMLLPGGIVHAQGDTTPIKRVLVVYEFESTLPSMKDVAQGLQQGFAGEYSPRVELYSEYLDTVRFPFPEHLEGLAEQFAAKFRDRQPDLVIAIGPGALQFMLAHRDAIAPGKPLIFGGLSQETVADTALAGDVWGVISQFDVMRSVALARALQPDARKIVLITGSSGFDRRWQTRVQAVIGTEHEGLPVEYISGLSLEGFKRAAAGLSRDTILLVLTMLEDADGVKYVSRDAIAEILAVSGAPAYSIYSVLIGLGLVGGFVEPFDGIGKDMADLGKQILAGTPPPSQFVTSTGRPVVDWRQLKRWGIDPELVPPDTELQFYDPSIWERYRLQIVGALAIIALQSATIIGLIVTDRRRRGIKEELALERLELAHLSRSSQLGELSGSIAHELNQPLTAILANAEAGAMLAEKDPSHTEFRKIFGEIATADLRASTIIVQLRQMMLKGEVAFASIDLNEAAAATIFLARSELAARQTRADFLGEQAELPVNGNLAQLQQVVLNLILNAADAMSKLSASERRIEIRTRVRENGMRELSVTDRGHGISVEMATDAFKPFVSTKAKGLGLGLPICRSIALAHGGTLEFDESMTSGARVVLTLPPP